MNAFGQLAQAARSLLHTELLGKEEPLSDEEVAKFLQANRPHLDAARETLRGECRVEYVYSEEFFPQHMDDIYPTRDLARAFRVELTKAERNGGMAEAVRAGVSVFDLAGAVRRGGLIIDMLIAEVLSGIGVDALRRLRHRLGIKELRLLIGELERVELHREAFSVVAARDEEWNRRFPPDEEFDPSKMEWPESEGEDGLDEETKQAIVAAIGEYAARPAEEKEQIQRDLDNRDLAMLRLLMVESGLLAYRLAHGTLPESLDALEPEFLAHVPVDPFVNEPFRYRREGENFVLYSVGPSRADGGGRLGSWADVSYGGADLFLDTFDCKVEPDD